MRTSLIAAGLALALVVPLAPGTAAGADEGPLEATIRITSYGIPHVLADDLASGAFGYGYIFARDTICTMAESYVTVRGERSRYFGPDGSYQIHGNGTTNNNLNSDFFHQRIIDRGIVEDLLAEEPPIGPYDEIRDAIRGYVEGYNHYLREVGGSDGIDDPTCRGEPWVEEISELDAYLRFYHLILIASQGVAIDGIGGGQPPPPGGLSNGGSGTSEGDIAALGEAFASLREIGSNAYGIGRDLTDNGRGIMLGNPHFPWQGPERFYQAHITVPGVMNSAGMSLYGVPINLIGFNEDVAWSHTVSTAFRFTPFELRLNPLDPTQYLYDDEFVDMDADEVTVDVLTDDGEIEPRTRTLYSTHHGPMFTEILGLPIFPWTPAVGFAMGDANADNFRALNHFFRKNLAESVGEIDEVLRTYLGIPWVNTIAADRHGDAYYADISVVPHVTDEHAADCNTVVGEGTFELLGLPVLDGSDPDCEWGSDPDAPRDGIFGGSSLPTLTRSDYTSNMNDSYWLTNPREPLTGYARIIGDEETARTLRTRIGILNLEQRLTEGGAPDGEPFTRETIQDIAFDNRQHAAELAYEDDALVGMCEQMVLANELQAETDPCEVLAAWEAEWDLRDDVDAEGALLFRRFWTHASGAEPSPWTEPFDEEDPVNTPRDLNTEHPEVRSALQQAIDDLQGAEIPLDAPLGEYQYVERNGERIPMHGGPGVLGLFNAMNFQWDSDEGYTHIPHGTSHVQVVHFQDGPCPDVGTILTYSQSTNPESPHHDDQTRLFAEKEWVDLPFCEEDILADPNLQVIHLAQDVDDAPAEDDSTTAAAPLPETGGGQVLVGLALVLLAASFAWSRARREDVA